MHVLVVGAGKMGVPIAWAMDKLGYQVDLVDVLVSNFAKMKFQELGISPRVMSVDDFKNYPQPEYKVCISAAPYFENMKWAQFCKSKSIPYCDLGGNVKASQDIQDYSTSDNSNVPVFTDLGLAPGLVNILGEEVWKLQSKRNFVENVFLRVGGLPLEPDPNSVLKYATVFSVEGLKGEYSGLSWVLKDGQEVQVPALDDLEHFDFGGRGNYEIFHTSGGLSTSLCLMKARGVKNLNYKTIRYPGHCQYIKFLLREAEVDTDTFAKIIAKTCPPTTNDKVLISAIASSSDDSYVAKHFRIVNNPMWTAMQQATAFPTAAVAAWMVEANPQKPVLNYSDVPFGRLSELLNQIGFLDMNEVEVGEAGHLSLK